MFLSSNQPSDESRLFKVLARQFNNFSICFFEGTIKKEAPTMS